MQAVSCRRACFAPARTLRFTPRPCRHQARASGGGGFDIDKIVEDLPVPVEYAYAGVAWGVLLSPLLAVLFQPQHHSTIGASPDRPRSRDRAAAWLGFSGTLTCCFPASLLSTAPRTARRLCFHRLSVSGLFFMLQLRYARTDTAGKVFSILTACLCHTSCVQGLRSSSLPLHSTSSARASSCFICLRLQQALRAWVQLHALISKPVRLPVGLCHPRSCLPAVFITDGLQTLSSLLVAKVVKQVVLCLAVLSTLQCEDQD